MTENEDWGDKFVAHLEALRDNGDRGALAALRRAAGSKPGIVADIYPHILPWVPKSRWAEEPAYIVGSLFALNPEPGGKGNLGTAFASVEHPSESLEKRFVALLNCHRDDLPNHLRQAISLLKSKDIPINWRNLLKDILSWDHEDRFVQQQWAREFWQSKIRTAS